MLEPTFPRKKATRIFSQLLTNALVMVKKLSQVGVIA
jgi:hypothetical protein